MLYYIQKEGRKTLKTRKGLKMMNREMMEEIFWMVGEEHGVNCWYEIYDSDLFEEVCERIARFMGLERGEYDSWSEMLDWVVGDEFSEWVNEMAEDL